MINFIKDGKKYDVELNGENYGNLEFNEERKTWVLWPNNIDDGIDYFESLEETQAAIKDELTK